MGFYVVGKGKRMEPCVFGEQKSVVGLEHES